MPTEAGRRRILDLHPQVVLNYAEKKGWVVVPKNNNPEFLWLLEHPKHALRQLLIPRDENDPQYRDAIGEVLSRLAEIEGRSVGAILVDLESQNEWAGFPIGCWIAIVAALNQDRDPDPVDVQRVELWREDRDARRARLTKSSTTKKLEQEIGALERCVEEQRSRAKDAEFQNERLKNAQRQAALEHARLERDVERASERLDVILKFISESPDATAREVLAVYLNVSSKQSLEMRARNEPRRELSMEEQNILHKTLRRSVEMIAPHRPEPTAGLNAIEIESRTCVPHAEFDCVRCTDLLTSAEAQRVVELIENPPPPTQKLIELMRNLPPSENERIKTWLENGDAEREYHAYRQKHWDAPLVPGKKPYLGHFEWIAQRLEGKNP